MSDEIKTVPRNLAHALWYEGGRLRTNLKASVDLNPENWDVDGVNQTIARWDAASDDYFDYALKGSVAPAAEVWLPPDVEWCNRVKDSPENGSMCGSENRAGEKLVTELREAYARIASLQAQLSEAFKNKEMWKTVAEVGMKEQQ